MKRFGMALFAASMLASCGKPPEAGNQGSATAPVIDTMSEDINASNGVANVAAPTRDTVEDKAAIRAVIDQLYAPYGTASGPTAKPVVSPDFRQALDSAEAADEGGLGYDPWCECQDFDNTRFKYDVKTIQFAPDGDHARSTLVLDLGFSGDGAGRVRKWIAFVRTSKGWLVDDLSDANGKSLKAVIRAAPSAAPGGNET